MKKILSACLTGLLAISAFTATAFAEDPTPLAGSNTVTAAGVMKLPAIKVTMPKSMAFVINPYKLKLDSSGKIVSTNYCDEYLVSAYNSTTTEGKGKCWSVVNNSGADIKAAYYVYTSDVSSTLKVVDSKTTITATEKGFTIKPTAQAYAKPVGDAAPEKVGTLVEGKLLETAYTGNWWGTADKTAGVLQIASVPDGGSFDIGLTTTLANKGGLTWTDADKFTLNFVFQFEYAGGTSA